MTTRRRFLQLLGIAPVIPAVLKLEPVMAAIQEPTVEKIVNYVEREIVRPSGLVVANKIFDVTTMSLQQTQEPQDYMFSWEEVTCYAPGRMINTLEFECACPAFETKAGDEISIVVERDSFRASPRAWFDRAVFTGRVCKIVRSRGNTLIHGLWDEYQPRLSATLEVTEPVVMKGATY